MDARGAVGVARSPARTVVARVGALFLPVRGALRRPAGGGRRNTRKPASGESGGGAATDCRCCGTDPAARAPLQRTGIAFPFESSQTAAGVAPIRLTLDPMQVRCLHTILLLPPVPLSALPSPPWHRSLQWQHRPLVAYAVTDLLSGVLATPLVMWAHGFRRLGNPLAGRRAAWDASGASPCSQAPSLSHRAQTRRTCGTGTGRGGRAGNPHPLQQPSLATRLQQLLLPLLMASASCTASGPDRSRTRTSSPASQRCRKPSRSSWQRCAALGIR